MLKVNQVAVFRYVGTGQSDHFLQAPSLKHEHGILCFLGGRVCDLGLDDRVASKSDTCVGTLACFVLGANGWGLHSVELLYEVWEEGVAVSSEVFPSLPLVVALRVP